MRINQLCLAAGLLGMVVAAGCWYQRPDLEEMFEEIEVGMEKDEVIEELGQPTAVLESEMFYLYDDPDKPVRFRFVLDEKALVIEKYYETKEELAKRAEEVKGEIPPVEPLPGEEGRTYPGGPLKRFDKPPGKK